MQITKATKKDQETALKIATNLKNWFTSYSGKMLLMWMGVKKEAQGKGVGQKLLRWLEGEGKKFGFHTIEVETLPDEYNYEPYQRTRSFYYENGFRRVLYKKARVQGWDDQIVLEKKL